MNFRINKKCNTCQAEWTFLPVVKVRRQKDRNNEHVEGYWFDCTCKSTLLVLLKDIQYENFKKEVG